MKLSRVALVAFVGAFAGLMATFAPARQYRNSEGNTVSQGVVPEVNDEPVSATNPLPSTPFVPTWAPVIDNTIDATNTYQVLCASARAGGTIQHQGAVGSGSLWLDVTGATGTTRSNAAMEVVARASNATGPGVYRFPPTTSAVTVYGPAGTPFQAFCG